MGIVAMDMLSCGKWVMGGSGTWAEGAEESIAGKVRLDVEG